MPTGWTTSLRRAPSSWAGRGAPRDRSIRPERRVRARLGGRLDGLRGRAEREGERLALVALRLVAAEHALQPAEQPLFREVDDLRVLVVGSGLVRGIVRGLSSPGNVRHGAD